MGIVLMILKILGITLLVILLIVLLLLAALLFCPFRYEIEAAGDKDGPQVQAAAKVRWLLRIVSFKYIFNKTPDGSGDGNGYILRVFGIPVKKAINKPGDEEEDEEQTASAENTEEASAEQDEAVTEQDGKKEEDNPSEEAAEADQPEAKPEAAKPEETSVSVKPEEASEAESAGEEDGLEEPESSEAEPDENGEDGDDIISDEDKPKSKLSQKIADLKEKITDKVSGLLDSFEALLILLKKKKGLLADYIRKKSTKKALKTAWNVLWWVLKHICPKKYSGNLEFGLEDPSLTGEICAAISPWYILIADRLSITPVFDGKLTARGDVYLKGRIRLWGFVVRAIKLYRDKNIRKVIKEAEKVKETLMETPDEVKDIFTSAA
ncbi:MAG: DUF2953 domain-containing protein [Lachnospiraceae bacterium]|nr:DUF2953 domain-containing protein [Lachnospiraceae bacterium]